MFCVRLQFRTLHSNSVDPADDDLPFTFISRFLLINFNFGYTIKTGETSYPYS